MMTADDAVTQAQQLIAVPTDNKPGITMLYCIFCLLYANYKQLSDNNDAIVAQLTAIKTALSQQGIKVTL